ncbi:MAG: hypothetical protein ACI8ZB_000929 [Desulforhopalus sp.]|jgi:hypothetical protein
MKTKILIFLSLFVLFLTSCSTVQVSQDYDNTYNFTTAKSYNWNTELQHPMEGILKDDELLADRFFSAIDTTLKAQGFSLSESPDFLVSWTYTVTSRLQADTIQPAIGVGYGRYGRYGGFGLQSGTSIRQYDRGQLTINIHDSSTRRLIWKGNGTREVFTHNSPEQLTKNVFDMVQSTLAQFPPTN